MKRGFQALHQLLGTHVILIKETERLLNDLKIRASKSIDLVAGEFVNQLVKVRLVLP